MCMMYTLTLQISQHIFISTLVFLRTNQPTNNVSPRI